MTFRAFGTDRLIPSKSGALQLLTRDRRDWKPRTESTSIRSSHPGTAVECEGELFEVISADLLESGGMRFGLAHWEENEAIRHHVVYDQLAAENYSTVAAATKKRERAGLAISLMAFVFGHAPAAIQRRIDEDYGIPAARLTLLSAIPTLLFGLYSIRAASGLIFKTPTLLPTWMIVFGVYLFFESLVRIFISMSGKPCGSLLLSVPFLLFSVRLRRGESAVPLLQRELPSDDELLMDEFHLKEPLFSLLPANEQNALSERFGFDGRRWTRRTASALLVTSTIGIFSSLSSFRLNGSRLSNLLAITFAIYLFVEQAIRLFAALRGQPHGSLLAPLVRPLLKRFR